MSQIMKDPIFKQLSSKHNTIYVQRDFFWNDTLEVNACFTFETDIIIIDCLTCLNQELALALQSHHL